MATAGMPLPPTFALPTALFYLHSTWRCGGRRPPLLRGIAYNVQSDGGRNPIGWRTESDWTADGIRSDGGRNLIGRRTESDRMADATKGQKQRLRHEKGMASAIPYYDWIEYSRHEGIGEWAISSAFRIGTSGANRRGRRRASRRWLRRRGRRNNVHRDTFASSSLR